MGDRAPPQVQRIPKHTFLVVMWLFTAASCVFLTIRLCIRIKIFKRLGWDDLLVIIAWFLLLASAITWQIKIPDLYWLYGIDEGKIAPTAQFLTAFASFVPFIAIWNVFYYTCLWSVKYSFLVFFRQMDSQANTQRVWWWVVFAITSAGLIAAIADIDYACSVEGMEKVETVCSEASHVNFDTNTLYGNMAIDVLTDILILSIPIRILWGVQMSRTRKLVLYGIFSATIVIMAISIIRAVLVKPDPSSNDLNSVDWLYIWSMIEMGVAIMIANVASFRQLFVGNSNQPDRSSRAPSSSSKLNLLSYLRNANRSFFTKRSHSSSSNSLGDPTAMDERAHSLTHLPSGVSYQAKPSRVYVESTIDVVSNQVTTQDQATHQASWNPVDRESLTVVHHV